MKPVCFLIGITLISFGLSALAQQEDESNETKWDVPELFAFHEVIYPIWHTAYPNKDIQMLKGFVNEVNSGTEKIFAVELPGILRDKEGKWKQGVEKLRLSVDEYNKASEYEDDQAMLDAAENLHSDYEMLVRIIKPLSKEIDEFHKELYMVYHYYLPENQIDKLKESSIELVKRAEAVLGSEAPKRIISKKDEYKTFVESLVQSAMKFRIVLENDELEKIDSVVEELHTNYQHLEKLFD